MKKKLTVLTIFLLVLTLAACAPDQDPPVSESPEIPIAQEPALSVVTPIPVTPSPSPAVTPVEPTQTPPLPTETPQVSEAPEATNAPEGKKEEKSVDKKEEKPADKKEEKPANKEPEVYDFELFEQGGDTPIDGGTAPTSIPGYVFE